MTPQISNDRSLWIFYGEGTKCLVEESSKACIIFVVHDKNCQWQKIDDTISKANIKNSVYLCWNLIKNNLMKDKLDFVGSSRFW